jgi:hypothetical protein
MSRRTNTMFGLLKIAIEKKSTHLIKGMMGKKELI